MTLRITKETQERINEVGRTRRAAIQRTRKAVLVYQTGIANVFAVDAFTTEANVGYVVGTGVHRRNAKRLLQHAFEPCEWFARGLAAAGCEVRTMQCNQAGDIANATWSWDLETAPFSDRFHPVTTITAKQAKPAIELCEFCDAPKDVGRACQYCRCQQQRQR